jgi:hypothetical protein
MGEESFFLFFFLGVLCGTYEKKIVKIFFKKSFGGAMAKAMWLRHWVSGPPSNLGWEFDHP